MYTKNNLISHARRQANRNHIEGKVVGKLPIFCLGMANLYMRGAEERRPHSTEFRFLLSFSTMLGQRPLFTHHVVLQKNEGNIQRISDLLHVFSTSFWPAPSLH